MDAHTCIPQVTWQRSHLHHRVFVIIGGVTPPCLCHYWRGNGIVEEDSSTIDMTNWPRILHMMTSSNGNIFRVTGHLCGEFTGDRWITHRKASDAEFDVFFDPHLNERLSKHWWGWWFKTSSRPLWRHSNVLEQHECRLVRVVSLAR